MFELSQLMSKVRHHVVPELAYEALTDDACGHGCEG